MDEELREKLAEIEHQRWADWQAWCHKMLRENLTSNNLEDILERWEKQIATPYNKLSREDQLKDLEQVNRYWPLIQVYCDKQSRGARVDELEKLTDLPNIQIPAGVHVQARYLSAIEARIAELESGPIKDGAEDE